jgi:DNA-binding XRE family transcriptional regulator
MKIVDYEDFKNELLKNEEVKQAYESLEDEFQLAQEIIKLRQELNLTQAQLAKECGTSQPAISRLESGNYKNLTLSFLRRLGKALGAEPVIHFHKTASA